MLDEGYREGVIGNESPDRFTLGRGSLASSDLLTHHARVIHAISNFAEEVFCSPLGCLRAVYALRHLRLALWFSHVNHPLSDVFSGTLIDQDVTLSAGPEPQRHWLRVG